MSENPTPTRSFRARPGLAAILFSCLTLLLVAGAAPAAEKGKATAAPAAESTLRLVVNIPAYRLDVFDGDRLVTSYPVTVGQPHEPTPSGRFHLK